MSEETLTQDLSVIMFDSVEVTYCFVWRSELCQDGILRSCPCVMMKTGAFKQTQSKEKTAFSAHSAP